MVFKRLLSFLIRGVYGGWGGCGGFGGCEWGEGGGLKRISIFSIEKNSNYFDWTL